MMHGQKNIQFTNYTVRPIKRICSANITAPLQQSAAVFARLAKRRIFTNSRRRRRWWWWWW